MVLSKETSAIQNELALFCRTGVKPSIPVSKPKNLGQYRRLVFNVVLNTMEQAFPIAYMDFSKGVWNDLVHDFFLNHDSQTPQIWKLPFEFYQFIVENKIAEKLNKPYLNDLLLFEWIEIEIHTMPDIQMPKYKNEGNLFTDILIINKEFKLIKLGFPVHIHPPKKAENLSGDYYLIAYRHPVSLNVNFLNLSVLHTFFIERLVEEKNTLNEIIDEASQIFNVEKDILITNISTFLNDMFTQKLILGYKILYNNI